MPDQFFTSDTHFGHRRILELGKGRPFTSIEDHDETLIANWNARVAKGDHVYHLGDFAFATLDRIEQILKRLNGEKHYILGNHDGEMPKVVDHFASFQHYKELKIFKPAKRIVLFHFPIASWNGAWKGSWHLHGHCHGSYKGNGPVIDVGVDNWGFAPVSMDELIPVLQKKIWTPVDHHDGNN